jgi:uncharacterized protein (TIGR04222 family)
MNPFDLRGPEFVYFYFVLGAVVIGLMVLLRRRLETGPVPRLVDIDPYLVAHLRGGADEALRIATVSLLDRGLLMAKGDRLVAETGAVERVRRPLERKILTEFFASADVSTLFSKTGPRKACEALASDLRKQRLLPGPNETMTRVLLGLATTAVLWWVAYEKAQLALSRGRHNLGLLFLLAMSVPFVVALCSRTPRTTLGDRVLQDLRMLFSRLKARSNEIRPGGATSELALLAGVFGLSALPAGAYAQAEMLFPRGMRAAKKSDTSWDNSCGSSCGSSGGSSCGGGGCGGGCGGCGS